MHGVASRLDERANVAGGRPARVDDEVGVRLGDARPALTPALEADTIDQGAGLLIDTHDAPIADGVWRLYERLIERIGARPTLIERDDNLPPFAELMAERDRAHSLSLPRARSPRLPEESAAHA